MKKIPQKVFIALDSINNTLQAMSDHKRRGRAYEVFFILDTLLSFKDSILRAIEKKRFADLLSTIRATMRTYSQYIDGTNNVTWETVEIFAKNSQDFLSATIESIR